MPAETTTAAATETVIHRDPEIMGGMPVFCGTRVPVRNLWDYLDHGHGLDEFMDDFPTVQRSQVLAVLKMARDMVEAHARFD